MFKEFYKKSLNGFQQYFYVEGDLSKPLILFVHGGPGSSNSPMCNSYKSLLTNDYLVVHYDQRGTWNAFDKSIDFKKFKVDDYVDDLEEVIDFLCLKYNKAKVILSGHSWGTILTYIYGIKRPEMVLFLINVGQVANTNESEREIYETLLNKANQDENQDIIDELLKIGSPPHSNATELMVLRKWGAKLHGSFKSFDTLTDGFQYHLNQSDPEYQLTAISPEEYGQHDPGLFSANALWPQLNLLVLENEVNLKIPFVICQGENDLHTTHDVAKNWFDKVKATEKEFITFQNSGHMTHIEDPVKFKEVIDKWNFKIKP